MENDVAPSGSWTDLQSLVGCGHFGLVKFGLGLSKLSPCRPILESIQRASWNRKKKLRVSYSIPGRLSRQRVRKSSPSRLSKYTDSLALTSCSHFWISLDFSIDCPFIHISMVKSWKNIWIFDCPLICPLIFHGFFYTSRGKSHLGSLDVHVSPGCD